MDLFFNDLKQRYKLSQFSIEQLEHSFEPITYRRRETFSELETGEQYTYFVFSGLIRAYFLKEDIDCTVFFAFERQMLSLFPGTQNADSFLVMYEALEDTTLYKVRKEKLESLFNTSLELSNWGRKLVEEKLLEYNNYFINYFYEEKGVQYKKFLAENPKIIQRVALKDLATYLNVTPQSLSRIRAQI